MVAQMGSHLITITIIIMIMMTDDHDDDEEEGDREVLSEGKG